MTTAFAVMASVWGPDAQAAPPTTDDPLWQPKQQKSVSGKNFEPLTVPADPAKQAATRWTPKVRWPQPGRAEVTMPPAASTNELLSGTSADKPGTSPIGDLLNGTTAPKARAGALPISIGTAEAEAARASSPASVRVELSRRGADGLLVRLTRTDGVRKSCEASLQLDYSAFRDAYGGDWALRLRPLELPA